MKRIIKKIYTLAENPELIGTIGKRDIRGFVIDFLFIKKNIGINPRTIFDVGAAVGSWTKAAHYIFPNATIYSFEPIPESYKRLLKIKESTDKIHTFNLALSSKDKKSTFYLNSFSYSSSLLQMTNNSKEIFPFTKDETTIQVECKRLDSITSINIERPAFLKLDVQGTELDVLEGMGVLLNEIDMIQIEVTFENLYKGQANYNEIFALMYANGFCKFLQLSPVFSKEKGLIYCDVIFFR